MVERHCRQGNHMALNRTSRTARKIAAVLGAAAMLGVTSCSSGDRAISSEDLRKLAGSPKAVRARQEAEKRLMEVIQAYDKDTPLTLELVTVNDGCTPGSGGMWPSGDDTYKIRCDMSVTAYYGAAPGRIGDVLDGVLSAGDRPPNGPTPEIEFGHDFYYATKVVDYYRNHGPNPMGPNAPEPTQLSNGSQTLDWDSVYTEQRPIRIAQPPACVKPDPPVTRCSHKPNSKTLTDIRRTYGMTFKLSMAGENYFEVFKDGKS